MRKRTPLWALEDTYRYLDSAIQGLPSEIDIRSPVEYFERAGGDRSHPAFKKLWAAVGELNDAVDEFVSHVEDMQHKVASQMPPED